MPYKDPKKQKAAQHAWYLRNREIRVEAHRQQKRKRREVVNAYKLERGCSRCGYNRCAAAIDAHHPDDKQFEICRAIQRCMNIDAILAELARCELLCSNCHRELHAV